ncbi:DUF3405 domain-containing protein [Methylorubrum sp. SB2]|uniref:DUF3405 domain-containing protein n=1 Tax=Methylorubrum subtropicum TaxID=3138812 RepID=UPI00313B1158
MRRASRRGAALRRSHSEIDRSALPEGSLVITYDEVVEGLDYPEKLTYRPGHFVDRDLDLPVIWFFRRYGGYRRYWLTEYDVRFSGHWMVLFDHFRDNAISSPRRSSSFRCGFVLSESGKIDREMPNML